MKPIIILFLFFATSIFSQNNCLKGDCQNGFGTKSYAEGEYEGFFENGKRNNIGVMLFNDKSIYIGAWQEDQINGFGFIKINDSIATIIGTFKNGKINGKGVKYFKNNTLEAGIYQDDTILKSYSFDNNNVQLGCTYGDCANLYGRYTFTNGDEFNGFFENNNMQYGSYVFADKTTYIGQFDANASLSGIGIYVFANGDYYFGNWKNGTYEGLGILHTINENEKETGFWKNGTLQIETND